ncbi:MAG: M23 family metallopeptidase [Cyclobacteriaceae bacterium]
MKYLLALLIGLQLLNVYAQEKEVSVYHEVLEDQSINIYAKNHTNVWQSVNVEGKIKGMTASTDLPVLTLLTGNETKLITNLVPEEGKSYSYKYKYTFIIGDVTAEHNDDYVYRLPFPKGQEYLVGQSYNEFPTHINQFAIDFNMDEGTKISAIRDGVVLQVVDKHSKGCPNESCSKYNNYIMVRHEDGSIADYSHIQKKGALVQLGDSVKAGQVIAKSGSTGWASGPHLHLEVYVMRFTGQESVKVEYHLDNSTIGIPKTNESYRQTLN